VIYKNISTDISAILSQFIMYRLSNKLKIILITVFCYNCLFVFMQSTKAFTVHMLWMSTVLISSAFYPNLIMIIK